MGGEVGRERCQELPEGRCLLVGTGWSLSLGGVHLEPHGQRQLVNQFQFLILVLGHEVVQGQNLVHHRQSFQPCLDRTGFLRAFDQGGQGPGRMPAVPKKLPEGSD